MDANNDPVFQFFPWNALIFKYIIIQVNYLCKLKVFSFVTIFSFCQRKKFVEATANREKIRGKHTSGFFRYQATNFARENFITHYHSFQFARYSTFFYLYSKRDKSFCSLVPCYSEPNNKVT